MARRIELPLLSPNFQTAKTLNRLTCRAKQTSPAITPRRGRICFWAKGVVADGGLRQTASWSCRRTHTHTASETALIGADTGLGFLNVINPYAPYHTNKSDRRSVAPPCFLVCLVFLARTKPILHGSDTFITPGPDGLQVPARCLAAFTISIRSTKATN